MSDSTALLAVILRFRRPIGILVHAMLIVTSAAAAAWLRFDGDVPAEYVRYFVATVPILVACRVALFLPFRLFQGLWRYTSISDLLNIVAGVASSSLLFFLLHPLFPVERTFPRSILVIDTVLLICLLTAVRLSRRIYRELVPGSGGRRVIVYGAGDAGELIVRDMRLKPLYDARPIGFLDDDVSKVGRRIHGLPVLGGRKDAQAILERLKPDEVLIAVPGATPEALRAIVRALQHTKVRITTLPAIEDLIGKPVDVGQIRELQLEDLLRRDPINLDATVVRTFVEGRCVLVTGAGGSIGSEICRQLADSGVGRLIALDQYENSLFELLNDLGRRWPDVAVEGIIADVTDEGRVEQVFATWKPQVVFHAAAHKHVPLMEANPCEAVKNNVRGTRLVAEAARRHGSARFVMISTDKAVNPTSVMGATKRVAELVVREVGSTGNTRFATVRFGNVLGSNGSVVPLFLEQIRRGGPVTVTHPDIRRYFMLIPEAVQLVLQAATLPDQGAAYVLEMGDQVRLVDLARDLIRLSGYIPDDEIAITFTTLRPGEKLFEELVGDDELVEASSVSCILRLQPSRVHPLSGQFLDAAAALEAMATTGDAVAVVDVLRHLVPGYAPQEARTLSCPS